MSVLWPNAGEPEEDAKTILRRKIATEDAAYLSAARRMRDAGSETAKRAVERAMRRHDDARIALENALEELERSDKKSPKVLQSTGKVV